MAAKLCSNCGGSGEMCIIFPSQNTGDGLFASLESFTWIRCEQCKGRGYIELAEANNL
jgi:hypothetical protein